MKFTILAAAILLFCAFTTRAQNSFSIKGSAVDSSENVKLINTTISVLNEKDSVLRAFSWAKADGEFAINNLQKGKYLLLVTYPGYADYVEAFALDSTHKEHDFGSLNMILKSKLLTEVIVKGEVTAIKIKGDTTEYNAKAYKIQPNAKVEDLLRQLPGIQVDKDGKITAQGQTVNNVLVDGEEFFGDDPTLVTKNLRADMVDKVQVYDKKSDQATFTGIDDGQKTKTINIKLKEDKKNGFFGKANGGAATDGYYDSQLLFNRFKAKQKFSIYGTIGNDGKTGLSWRDDQKYNSSSELQYDDSGGMFYINGGSNDGLESYDGRYDGNGKPMARTAGMHYDSKWNNDKESININYKIGSIGVTGASDNLSQRNFTDSLINSNTHNTFNKYMFRQKLDFTYQVKLDTATNLKVTMSGMLKNSRDDQTNIDTSYVNHLAAKDTSLLNNQHRTLMNNVDERQFSAGAFLSHKFKKKGRTISLQVNENYDRNEAKGYLQSQVKFYNHGVLDSISNINQYKPNTSSSSVFNSNITYTEPLSKELSMVLNYGIGVDHGVSDQRTYDTIPGVTAGLHPRYGALDTLYSNNFKLDQFTNQGGLNFNFKKGKSIINFGTRISDIRFKQVNQYTDTAYTQHFINWQPQASFMYMFSQQESFRIGYSGSSQQPAIWQIQPVRNNSDPLNISIGNPDLKQSFRNGFDFYYNSYKVISSQSIWINGGYSFTTNPIVNSTNTVDGKTTYESVNIDKARTDFYLYGSFYRKIKKLDINYGFNVSANGNKSFNYTNDALNTTKSYNYGVTFNLSKYKVKAYDVYLNFGPNYTINESSLQQSINSNGRGYNGQAGFNYYLPLKFLISADANYQFTGKTQSFNTDFSKCIVNASITKSFFKDENLKIILSGNDILNQNVGFSRAAYDNIIMQNSNITIRRFFMLSVSWDFSKFGQLK